MTTPSRRAGLAALAALLLAAGAAGAQPAPRDTSPVPRELVELLFGRYGLGMRDIVVGRAPSGFPEELEPEHVRVVGGVGGPMGGEAIFEVGQEPGGVAASMLTAMERSGWEPMRIGSNAAMRGFVGSQSFGPVNQLCKERWSANVMPHRQFDRSYLRITWTVGERSPCEVMRQNQSDAQRQMERRFAEVPTLQPPAGVEVQGGGTSTGGDSWSVSARATGGVTATGLLDHYIAEMKRAGWTQAARHATDSLGVATFTKPADEGEPWYALLTVMPEPRQARSFGLDLRGRRAGPR